MSADALRRALDEGSALVLDEGRNSRRHLGASEIGARCARQAFYSFRWFYRVQHGGRVLRLFDRGSQEEFRVIRWLRAAGFEVQDHSERLCWHPGSSSYGTVSWDSELTDLEDVSESELHIRLAKEQGLKLRQWGFTDHDNHFAGSCDGKLRGPAGLVPEGWGGAEFKTHNDKSYNELVKKGVVTSKPVHWVQMQIYMHYLGLAWCLYFSVNKNDDHIYTEIVYYKPEIAQFYIDRAGSIIRADGPPARLTKDPSWFECKFCDFREICHYDREPLQNCRTCAFSEASTEGRWYCKRYNQFIPESFEAEGCGEWSGMK